MLHRTGVLQQTTSVFDSWQGNCGPEFRESPGVCHTWMPDSQARQTRLDGATATLSFPKDTDCPLIAFKKISWFLLSGTITVKELCIYWVRTQTSLGLKQLETHEKQARLEGRATLPALWGTGGFIWASWSYVLFTEVFVRTATGQMSQDYIQKEVIHRSVNNAFILSERCLDG